MRGLLVLLLALPIVSLAQANPDLNVLLMQSTFMLEGRAVNGTTLGTGFVLLRPVPHSDPQGASITGTLVLITAAHVFDGMIGDTAMIHLRVHEKTTGDWAEQLASFRIRSTDGRPLWTRHPSADIAVMYVTLPVLPFEQAIPTNLLADDDILKNYRMGPGVQLNCLGYPLGDKGIAGFPILRTGVIASYPLVPTRAGKKFLFDFRVFMGNSGGPVYFKQEETRGSTTFCCGAQFIMGLVTDEELYKTPENQTEPYKGVRVQQLSIGWVVHASLIQDAINLLPTSDAPGFSAAVVPVTLNAKLSR
jgi:hypothetical protein